jgi:hypothetical protein
MKNTVFSTLVLTVAFAAATASIASATPASNAAQAHPVKYVERFGNAVVAVGTPLSSVLASLGAPAHKLAADVWAYSGFNAGLQQDRHDDCSTLLIRFQQGKVSEIKLVNDRAEKIVAAQLRDTAANRLQVAAK